MKVAKGKKIQKLNKKGFTLAEVLLTLAILGIIAALTIPSLIKIHNEAQIKAGAKRAYSVLSKASARIKTEKITLDFSATGTNAELRDAFCDILGCIKKAPMNQLFASYHYWYESTNGWNYSADTHAAAILNNGMLIKFEKFDNNCNTTEGALTGICAVIDIDTNGKKGPAMFGKDVLGFRIIKKDETYVMMPIGSYGDLNTCVSPGTDWADSMGCTAYYILGKELP